MNSFECGKVNTEVQDYMEQQVIPALNKVLKKTTLATFTISTPENSFFISDLIFADIKFKDDTQSTKIVIKRWPRQQLDQEIMKSMFNNEILFYTKYAKYSNNRLPRCYHAVNSGKDSYLILEDVTSLGFSPSSKAFDLELDYVLASVKEIAKFHSVGYVMKFKHPEEFKDIVSKIQETRFQTVSNRFEIYVNTLAPRSISYLRSINYDSDFCDKMQNFLENAFQRGITECLKPVEPLATLCHGDFLRNNILFKKSEMQLEAMLIDWATIRYSTPAIDLSTFFHLSCSRTDVVHRFDQIFGLYCDTLHNSLMEEKVPSMKDFCSAILLEDYKRNAIYGFVIASYFLPLVIYGCPKELPFEDLLTKPAKEYSRKFLAIGGDKMTLQLANMLLDLKNSGSLDRFLK